MFNELIELKDEHDALKDFLNDELLKELEDRAISPEMTNLMLKQAAVMEDYIIILIQRLELMNIKVKL